MAIKRARNAATKNPHCKKPTYANTAGSSSSSVPMPSLPLHGANHVQPPPPPLPPGVYFSPTPMECLGLLNRWIAGDNAMPDRDTLGHVRGANVYGESPDALRQRHPPASVREREHTWWFLSQTRFQSKAAGGGASKRADRHVEAGGYWRLEQKKEKLDDDGFKNCFGYYVGPDKRTDKTPWLMQEFTSANDDGAGKRGVPALYRVYVTPHASNEELTEIFGEDGVKYEPGGKEKKPARTMVPEEYFDRIAALLPEGSVRGGVVAQAQAQAPPPPPYEQQQQAQYYQHQQYQQDQYCQHQQYQQQQLSMVAPPLPPPASPGLLAELGADAPSDKLSMPMAYFMRMMDEEPAAMVTDEQEQPAEMVNDEQPAVTIKGEEPNWESFDNIVDDDELANFNKEC